jgi:hypothetical protein
MKQLVTVGALERRGFIPSAAKGKTDRSANRNSALLCSVLFFVFCGGVHAFGC